MSSPERPASIGNTVEIKRAVEIKELKTIFTASIGGQYLTQTTSDGIIGQEGRNFQPIQANPIRVVRVQTADGDQLLIQDGHHTADGILRMHDQFHAVYEQAISYYNTQLKAANEQDWQPMIIDVTTNYLDTPPPPGQQPSISMNKYFEIITPHTLQQAKVLKERTGLYAMSYWPSIAGEELSAQLSSFATLVLLASERYKTVTTEKDLADLLHDDTYFFANASSTKKGRYIAQ